MLADDPPYDFLHYLTCDLPLGYPLKKPVASLLSPTQKSSSRRELLHRQAQFLEFAKPFGATHPWILYLATVKHEAVFFTIPTHVENLVDVVDQLFYRDLQATYQVLRDAARAGIDEVTAANCERLVRLQTESAQIEDATKKVRAAMQAGFRALDPLPPAPPEPEPASGWSLLVTAKEKARVEAMSAAFKAYLLHENYRALCLKSVGLILTLPSQTRASALLDLPSCLAALETLAPEREALEAAYIRPFVAA